MNQINGLSAILNEKFQWNKARMDCFAGMLVGVIKARSVNLTEIALMFSGTAKMESNYRRIQRFLHDFNLDFNQLAWFVMALFGFLNTDYELVLDRTNWKWGKKHQYLDVGGRVQRNSNTDLLAIAS
jgi:hypothetical protein